MNISEVAQRSGLSTSAIRFYEEKGLIQSIGRQGQRRVFDRHILDQLAVIALGRAAGFSLQEIATMLPPKEKPQIKREMLTAKADELEQRIRRLKAVRDGLRHAAVCPEASHMDFPTFQRLMRAASAGEIKALSPSSSKQRKPRAASTRQDS